jgi:SAM-dependent methyltransferase
LAREPKNLLVNTIHDRALRELASKYLSGRLVDIGCGVKPYRAMLAPYVTEHVGVDHLGTQHAPSQVDLWGTAYNLPVPPDSFDSAVCTAVLEHLEEPEQALRECYRVLRPGGVALYSVPFIWHLHEEPRDFYRLTKYAISYLSEKVGFELLELRALSGFWVTFGQLLVYNLYRYHRGPLRVLPVIPLIGLGVQGVSYLLDRIDRAERWTWMYMFVVRKPAR